MSVYKKDAPRHLRLSIESILNQSYANFRLLVGVDGSVGEELESELKMYEANDKVVSFWFKENRGLTAVLNDLIEEGKKLNPLYIARMDADDICLSNRFEKQIIYMNNHKNIDICGGHIEEMDENKKSIGVIRYPLSHDEMKCFFGKRNPLAHVSVIFRKSYFHKAGLYPVDTDKDEDTIFWLNGFLSGCKFANIDEVLVRVRVNKDFYLRRNGLSKSLSDLKNRCLVIRKLNLSYVNYIFACARFVIFIIPIPHVTQFAYKFLR